jgi:hypothetical protein
MFRQPIPRRYCTKVPDVADLQRCILWRDCCAVLIVRICNDR